MHLRERQEIELAVDIDLDLVALVRLQAIPFVHGHHQRAARFQDEAGDMRILLGNILLRVQHQHHHVGFGNRLQGLHHREFLDRFEYLAAAADAGRVDQRVLLAIALERNLDRIARRARHVESDHALFAQQGVDQGRLAHVRTADEGDLDAAVGLFQLFRLIRALRERQVQHHFDEVVDAVAVRRRNRVRIAHAQFIEFGHDGRVAHAFAFIDHQQDGTTALAQEVDDGLVMRGQALTAIHDEHHHVGLGHGLLGLQCHLVHDAFLGDGFETTRIDDQEGTFADTAFAIVTIARQPRQIRHQRIARAGQTIE